MSRTKELGGMSENIPDPNPSVIPEGIRWKVIEAFQKV